MKLLNFCKKQKHRSSTEKITDGIHGLINNKKPLLYGADFKEFDQNEYFPNWKEQFDLDPSNKTLKDAKSELNEQEYQHFLEIEIESNYLRIKQEVHQLLLNK